MKSPTGLRPEERAERYNFASEDLRDPATMVALEDGLICGFATTAPARDADMREAVGSWGELFALYVDPEWWGRGVGAALISAAISAARSRLLELGYRNAVLWLLAGNARAERFYRIDGWLPDGLSRSDTVWGVMVDEVRYRRVLD